MTPRQMAGAVLAILALGSLWLGSWLTAEFFAHTWGEFPAFMTTALAFGGFGLASASAFLGDDK